MAIVCGTDFSPGAASAADVSALLAARLRTGVELVHVLRVEAGYLSVRDAMREATTVALQREVERLRPSGAAVRGRLLEGSPDEVLTRLAREENAEAVIVSALGTRSGRALQLGGTADRITRLSEAPVLVLRDSEPFLLWLSGQRRLRALVAVDRSAPSIDALRFLGRLRTAAPIDVRALHVYWAFDENHRLGLTGVRSWVEPEPSVEAVLRRELEAELSAVGGEGVMEVELALTLGRAADRIVEATERGRVDLVLVGSHRRNLVDRLWNGSTSRRVLRDVQASVAVVTASAHHPREVAAPVGAVLVGTDFSETADAAIAFAYRLVRPGGIVHVVHVSEPPSAAVSVAPRDIFDRPSVGVSSADAAELERALRERLPVDASATGIRTDTRVVWASPQADGLLQAARRLGVDVVVVGTRGRSGIAMTVLGSVAQEVAARSEAPVLLVHPQRR